MDKWLKIRRHDWKEPLQISQHAKFLIAWDQALRWKGGGGVEEEESKLGVGEKKTTTAWLAWLTDIFLSDPFFAFSLQRFKKPWKGLFSDLT